MTAMLLGRRRRYLSVSEFAALTGVPEATIRDRCERGDYRVKPGHVAGRKWAIVASEVDREIRPVR